MSPSEIVKDYLSRGRELLMAHEAKRVVASCGIQVTPWRLARNPAEAVEAAEGTGYPVVMKLESLRFPHKSDAGGVLLDLRSPAEVESGFRKLRGIASAADPEAAVSVEPMLKGGVEVIVGTTMDPHFGPVLMCGLGGVLAEVIGDVSFRLIPLSRGEAESALRSLRGFRILGGYRGQPPADLEALLDIIERVSNLVGQVPAISQLDLNPVLVRERGAVVLDARMVLSG